MFACECVFAGVKRDEEKEDSLSGICKSLDQNRNVLAGKEKRIYGQ